MHTAIICLFVVAILCLLIALDGLRRLLSLLPGIQWTDAASRRSRIIVGVAEILLSAVFIIASFFVAFTQPIFGPSVITTRAAVHNYLRMNYPNIDMTDFSMSKPISNEAFYDIRAGSSLETRNLVVTFDPDTKTIIEIKEK